MAKNYLYSKKSSLHRLEVSPEVMMDAEQIAIGGYAPLKGFMLKKDFVSVLKKMRLTNKDYWTVPIVLDVNKNQLLDLRNGDEVLIANRDSKASAIFLIEAIYTHDKSLHCKGLFKTENPKHPGVAKVLSMGDTLVGGRIKSILRPNTSPVRKLMKTPKETRLYFKKRGWKTIAAFHTRNVVHRAHEYLQGLAMEYCDGLLIHPVAGTTKEGDFKKELIFKSYQRLIKSYYPNNKVLLAALGIGMKFAGPKEAVFHALVRKNYGCTHIIIGRDHAGVGEFYDKYAAHRIFTKFPNLGIIPLLFKGPFYCKRCKCIATENTCSHNESYRLQISGTTVRKLIGQKKRLPEWLMRREIADLFIALGKKAFVEIKNKKAKCL